MATVTITERGNSEVPQAITIVRVQEFLRTPFPGFTIRRIPNRRKAFRVTANPEHAVFLSPNGVYTTQIDHLDLHLENYASPCFTARTEDELAQLATILFNKPVYVMAKCKVQVGEQYEWNTRVRQYIATDFVVRLETETDSVRAQLMRLFEKARECIRRGKRFYTKIDMNRIIQAWFERNASRRIFSGTCSAHGAQFGFSNASAPCCEGSCGGCPEDPGTCLCASLFCLPFALLCCLPYCVYRKALFKDRTHHIAGDVKIGFNVTLTPNELFDLIDRYDRTRMQEEHERLYGPMGNQPPPYSPSSGSPGRGRTVSRGSTTAAAAVAAAAPHLPVTPAPTYSPQPGGSVGVAAGLTEEPPPYSESDERIPILSNV